jgi:hypothetical protein
VAGVLREEHREAAKRVADTSRQVLEDTVLWLTNSFLTKLLDVVAYTSASMWSEVQQKLAERGLEDPSTDDILSVLEEMSDLVDFDKSIEYAKQAGIVGRVAEAMLGIAVSIAKKFASRELINKFTYDKVLEQASKRNLDNVVSYLTRYPKLTRKLIDWLRGKILSEQK